MVHTYVKLDALMNNQTKLSETTTNGRFWIAKSDTEYKISTKELDFITLPQIIQTHILNITSLDLSNCELCVLPDSLMEIHNLEQLILKHNYIQTIPNCLLHGLSRIRELDFSYNHLKSVSKPRCAISLLILKLNDNHINDMPSWVWESNCRLKEFDISNNSIDMSCYGYFYKSYHSTSRMKWLSVSNCNFGRVDMCVLRNIPHLTFLNIGNTGMNQKPYNSWELDLSVLQCRPNLLELRLPYLGVTNLPENIYELKSLKILDASFNCLYWLPELFTQLSKLEICYLSNNSISILPEAFENLTNLKEVYLSNNCIGRLPPNMNKLINLKVLDLYNNSIDEINMEDISHVEQIDLENNYLKITLNEVYQNKKHRLRSNLKTHIRSDGMKINEEIIENDKDRYDHYSSGSEDSFIEEKSISVLAITNETINKDAEEETWDDIDDFVPHYKLSFSNNSNESSICSNSYKIVKYDSRFFEDALE